MGDAVHVGQVYRRLVGLLSEKHDLSYEEIMGWIRCNISFFLVRSVIMCIRGAQSRLHCPVLEVQIPMDV